MNKLAISGTKEGIKKLIDSYFYSDCTIDFDKGHISNKKGILSNYKVEFKRKRYYFLEIN